MHYTRINMYIIVLTMHSLIRWLVLAGLLFALYRAYHGLAGKRLFSKADNIARIAAATFAHIQLIIGLWLYFISPVVSYFLENFKTAVHERGIRFFGMEHSTMMLGAIVVITIGSVKAKRKATDREKFKSMATWFTIALVILLINIPWPFSPFAARPYFRF